MNTLPATVHTLPAAAFAAGQRRHFALAVALPTLLALAGPLWAPELLALHSVPQALGLLLGMWFVVGGIGVSVGLHRHFSHRSFEARPALRAARVAWQGHLAWVWSHNVPKPTRYSRELLADALVRRLCRAYPACVALGVLLPAVIAMAWFGGWQGALFGAYWGGVVRIALGDHVIWSINSICHLSGRRPAATGDHSGNVGWLALVSFGESWHNNHHAQPTSPRFGHGRRQPDIGWAVVQLAVWLGWARLRVAGAGQSLDAAPAKAGAAAPNSGAANTPHHPT